jgi:hypothetical protein
MKTAIFILTAVRTSNPTYLDELRLRSYNSFSVRGQGHETWIQNFSRRSLNGRDRFGGLDVAERIILKMVLKEHCVIVLTGFISIGIRTGGGLLWTQ